MKLLAWYVLVVSGLMLIPAVEFFSERVHSSESRSRRVTGLIVVSYFVLVIILSIFLIRR